MRYPLPTLAIATQFRGGPELEIQFQGHDIRSPIEADGAKAHRAAVWAIHDGSQKAVQIRDIAVVNRDDEATRGEPVPIGGRPVPEPDHVDALGLDATLLVDRGMGRLQHRARPEQRAIRPATVDGCGRNPKRRLLAIPQQRKPNLVVLPRPLDFFEGRDRLAVDCE